MKRLLIVATAIAATAFAAGAAEIYTVTESVQSGGVDLTALGDGYRQDAIAGKAGGADLPIAITGRVVHASGLTPENPFIVSNIVASSYFILTNAGLVGEVPLLVRGSGTTYFAGTTITNDSDEANGMIRARAATQIDNLYVCGKDTPGMMYITNSTFYVLNNTYIGRDGGSGKIYSTAQCLGRPNAGSGAAVPWVGQRNTAYLYFGTSSAVGKGFSSGTLHLKNCSASAWHLYFGNANNDLPPDDGQEHYAGELILEGSSSYFVLLYGHVGGATDSIIRFRGGRLSSHGWGTYMKFENNSSANLICQGENGNVIDLYMNKWSDFVSWGSGSTGHLIMRGASDVYLYGGDGKGQSGTWTLEDGSKYTDTLGGMRITDPNHRIDWQQTGGLKLRSYSSSSFNIIKVLSSYLFPSNSWNGGVDVDGRYSVFHVNLLGTSQACNSLTGGGKLTNGVATASTIYIGSHGNACEFDAELCDGGAIDIVKRGAGAITLKKPIPYTFTLEEGSAIIPAGSTFATPGALVTAAGTSIALQGSTFAPPADYDMNAAATAAFNVGEGGTLVVGGDGADQTVDFSKVLGIGTIRKIGANAVTLVNASAFSGGIDVQGGTLSLAASAGTVNVASVAVAVDATLSLAGGVHVNTSSLSARGATGASNTLYGGAEGATAIDGISGAGAVYVVPPSATWTGAVDDDPENLDNWTGLVSADALNSGLLAVNFSESDPNGAWNVSKAYSFKAMNFDAAVASFAFNRTSDAAKISIGAGGVSIADERAAASYFDFETPVDFTASHVTLDFGANVRARFHAPLGGIANGAQKIAKVGAGYAYLYTTNSTFDGSFAISNGYAYAYGNEPFGPNCAAGDSQVYVDGCKSARLYLVNASSSKNFQLHNNATYRNALYSAANSTNTITGWVRCGNVCRIDVGGGSVLYLDGGYGKESSPDDEYVNWSGDGIAVFRDEPLYCGTFEASIRNLHLHTPGNKIAKIYAWADWDNGGDPYNTWNGTLKFGADWALDSRTTYIFINGSFDLNGTEQRIGAFRNRGTVKSLGAPGTLRLACPQSTLISNKHGDMNTVTPSTGDFAGSVNLVVEANDGFTFSITNRAVSATGNVEVACGTLKFCGTASWLGATNVTVSGGTLVVPHSKTLGRYTDVFLKAGSMQLDAGVEQKVKFLYLDGAEKRARVGRYGALDNMSVPAGNRTARITGPGVLNVLGEFAGSVLMFR